MRILAIALLFIASKVFSQTTPVQNKVISYAMGKMGKKVDRGECWDLASAALNFAEADWAPPLNFGTKIDHKKQPLEPGDILQFSNTSMKFPNGSMSFPKHTAIVYKASDNRITLLHQNFNNKRYVDTLTINLDYMKSGKLEAFRPKPKQ
jgi:hypothetical protein